MKTEHIHGALVCRAGKGEWYNQPHDKRWDMGEDSADLPPARWHVELQETIDAKGSAPSVAVVDVTEMDWLVGQDWGFLLRLCQRLTSEGSKLSVLATERVVSAATTLGLDQFSVGTST